MLRQEQIIKCFLHLPEKLLLFHELENISEFILHALCDQNCFNLSKAAYFIDNHDFDHLKGIVGFDKNESYKDEKEIWDNRDNFSVHMKQCTFNQKVRTLNLKSTLKTEDKEKYLIEEVAKKLEIYNPSFYSWKIKYDNHGILIFETISKDNYIDHDLIKAVTLLGFCPTF